MPHNIFNLYSAEAFAQHPMSLWSLDDELHFVSLVSGSAVYSVVGGASASVSNPPTEKPQETVGIADISLELDSFVGSASATTITTQSFTVPDDIDTDKQTVCISAFIYTYGTNISQLDIGFQYGATTSVKTYTSLNTNAWTKITYTMDVPSSGSVTPYINVVYDGIQKTFSLYNFAVGQWSEEYNHESQGTVPIPFASNSSSTSLSYSIGGALSASPSLYKTVTADAYGLSDEYHGYYFVENNKMLARNTSLPMTFGAANITELSPSAHGIPSLVVPGRGFLHSNGKYRATTAEFWLRIYPDVTSKTRIFGPVTSKDGLYVDKEFLTLRIGPYEKSYFIGKWYRPMLIDIVYTETFIGVMINGDMVIEQTLVSINVDLPNSSITDTDWLGFYCTSEIKKFEVDCIGIYPYTVERQIAKKKFIYGQGVGPVNDVTRKFGSVSAPIDFSFSDYSNNLIYPDMTKWISGFYSNIDADSKFITLPKYSLPEIKYFGQDLTPFNIDRRRRTWGGIRIRTWYQWLSNIWRQLSSAREIEPLFDNFTFQEDRQSDFYIRLKPLSTYDEVYGSIVFNSLNIISDPITSTFGLFSLNTSEVAEAEVGSEITIMHFKNNSTGDTFRIIYDDASNQIQYIYNSTTIKTFSFTPGASDTYFIAGLRFADVSREYATTIRKFFSIPQNIRLNVGGNGIDQFVGKIYRINFNNNFFTRKDVSSYFDSEGFAYYNSDVELSLSDAPFSYVGNYTLFFSKANDSIIMDIASAGYWEDSIPLTTLGSYVLNSNGQRESYDLDVMQFNIDYPASLLSQDSFDTESNLKAYVTLQTYQDVGKVAYSNYTNTKALGTSRYVDFENISTNIDTTKFRVVNGTLIFAPKRIIDFKNAYITVHLEMKSPGIYTNPIKIQRMSVASLSYDEASLYPINTSTGQKLYPFTRDGISYINKSKNPVLISKDTTPYLYLTGDSGIQTLPYPEVESTSSSYFRRGISIPLNQDKKENYTMHGLHMWCFYNKSETISARSRMFSISYQNTRYDLYLEPETGGKRAKVVPYLSELLSETITDEIVMYSNGIKQDVYVTPLSWALISLRFENPVSLNSIRGQLEVYPGVLFNNVTVFEDSIYKRVDDIFESHLGLSNIVSDDSTTLAVNFDKVDVFSDIKWTTYSGKPL